MSDNKQDAPNLGLAEKQKHKLQATIASLKFLHLKLTQQKDFHPELLEILQLAIDELKIIAQPDR